MEDSHSCHTPAGKTPKKRWFQNPLVLTSAGTFLLLALSFLFPFLVHFRIALLEYLRMMWLPIVLGFVAGGLMDYYIPQEYISKFLAARGKRTIFYSTALGFLASACSHGIIALSMELHKKGASGPAVVSFLLASPWANLPITILLIGFFGPKGFFIIGGALLVSTVTGLLFQILDRKGWIESNPNSVPVNEDFSILEHIRERLRGSQMDVSAFKNAFRGVSRGMFSLADMILWWIIVGMVLASLISAFVPESIFHRFLGPSFIGLLVTLGAAAVLEICSEGTAPLAFEIYRQTGAFGNAFAFLMGGVVTDYTEVGLVWMNLGRKTALWMLALTIPQVLLLGWLFNLFF